MKKDMVKNFKAEQSNYKALRMKLEVLQFRATNYDLPSSLDEKSDEKVFEAIDLVIELLGACEASIEDHIDDLMSEEA